ncbi:MAG: glycoside hydrolase family 13 protein [bacterium]
MEKSSILHLPKSNYAYGSKNDEMTIWLRVKRDDVTKVSLRYTDPFHWHEGGFKTTTVQMYKKYQTKYFDYYKVSFTTITKRTRYIFIIESESEMIYYGAKLIEQSNDFNRKEDNLFNYFNFPYINEEDILHSPKWSKEIVWYQIFIDRFCNKDNKVSLEWNCKEMVSNKDRFGGNILGVIEKLDYLKDLGIGGIYFTPLFEATSIHKYDTINYKLIDSDFGSNDDMKLLIKEAHKRGIKIMLDIVFNHCGKEHPFFEDVIKNYKNSEYYDYFTYFEEDKDLYIDNKPNYHTFAFTGNMPKWNTANKKVREYLLDITSYWIKEFDIDGYRLDVSNEVSHLFWKEFCNLCRGLKSDFVIIGENWDNSLPWLGVDQFDSVMNYELFYPIIRFFNTNDTIESTDFVSMINELIVSYPENYLTSMFNLIGCHDTMRVKTSCNENEDLVKLIFIFLFSFTGCPNIYYGDEVGLSGGNDPDNRRCMNWDMVNNDFYQFVKKTISIRKENVDILSQVDMNWLHITDNVLVYSKSDIYFVINKNDCVKDIKINIEGNYINLFTNEKIKLTNDLKLNNFEYLVLKKI